MKFNLIIFAELEGEEIFSAQTPQKHQIVLLVQLNMVHKGPHNLQ